MSDPHRGAYAPPTDAPLSFDARQPVRGSRPLPLTLIISAVVLATLLVGVFLVYRNGIRGPNEPPRTVGEPVAEMKTAPAPDQNKPDEAAGLQIYSHENPTASPTYAAPPEEPMARPTPPPAPAPVQSASLPPAKAPVATTPSAPVSAAPAKPAPAKPAPSIESLATAAVAPPKPAAAAPKPAAAASGPASVQIGALSSTALADKAWSDAARVAPGLAAGKGKKVEAIDKNGSTLYRTSVTGFSSRADAKAFCDALSAAGKSCFVK
ncbi:cell division protein FtsN [Caulobacter hibisci]|uniref:SPOR domain-containing protein n=1 Tax=Caulobacter hibisci TaxID=2035993 RepID=A0ABS0T7A0_9CAUL|nr:SPOR domain-containing protein [Caulobacter hibisci]MBI1686722.1 SPOR domain-containing protein [Caulobacter hibisci]